MTANKLFTYVYLYISLISTMENIDLVKVLILSSRRPIALSSSRGEHNHNRQIQDDTQTINNNIKQIYSSTLCVIFLLGFRFVEYFATTILTKLGQWGWDRFVIPIEIWVMKFTHRGSANHMTWSILRPQSKDLYFVFPVLFLGRQIIIYKGPPSRCIIIQILHGYPFIDLRQIQWHCLSFDVTIVWGDSPSSYDLIHTPTSQ